MGMSGKRQGHTFLRSLYSTSTASCLYIALCAGLSYFFKKGDLLTKLGATLCFKGQGSHPHHQMILTEE